MSECFCTVEVLYRMILSGTCEKCQVFFLRYLDRVAYLDFDFHIFSAVLVVL